MKKHDNKNKITNSHYHFTSIVFETKPERKRLLIWLVKAFLIPALSEALCLSEIITENLAKYILRDECFPTMCSHLIDFPNKGQEKDNDVIFKK